MMPFCSNCEAQIKDEDRFCPDCGVIQDKHMQDSGKKTQASVLENGGQNVINEIRGSNEQTVQESFSIVINIMKEMIIAPVITVHSILKKDYKQEAYILAAVIAVIQELLFMWFAKQMVGRTGFGEYFSLPYGRFFLYYLILFAVSLIEFWAAIYLLGRFVFKGGNKTIAVWNTVVFSSVPFTAGLFIGLIIGYISIYLEFVIFLIGLLVSLLCIYNGTKDNMDISENRTAYTVSIAFLVMLFLIYFTAKEFLGSFFNSFL